jgi:hypothetical protein
MVIDCSWPVLEAVRPNVERLPSSIECRMAVPSAKGLIVADLTGRR